MGPAAAAAAAESHHHQLYRLSSEPPIARGASSLYNFAPDNAAGTAGDHHFGSGGGGQVGDFQGVFLQPTGADMATNGRPPSRPPPPLSRPPPPVSRPPVPGANPGPPPSVPPPPVPASPMGARKLSLGSYEGNLATPPSSVMFKRQPEKMEDNKFSKFGEVRVRSPSPRRVTASGAPTPTLQNGPSPFPQQPGQGIIASPLPFNMNGSTQGDMQNFLSLLEREEADFVDQVKKSKSFIQNIIKDKEELGVVVGSQAGKIQKLEGERMDYQKKIIEAEREKRDFHDRLEQERQAGMQAVKKIEKQKRDFEKLQQESAVLAKERNEAIAKLTKEMKELERLEGERKEMFERIDSLERDRTDQRPGSDISKNVSDLNMKLKLEIGSIRSENEALVKANEQIRLEIKSLEDKIQVRFSKLLFYHLSL